VSNIIDLTAVHRTQQEPWFQELKATVLKEGAPKLIAFCESIIADTNRSVEAIENVINYRDSLIAKYGRPSLSQMQAGIMCLADDWTGNEPKLAILRAAWMRLPDWYVA
jgi:hypothetical protein